MGKPGNLVKNSRQHGASFTKLTTMSLYPANCMHTGKSRLILDILSVLLFVFGGRFPDLRDLQAGRRRAVRVTAKTASVLAIESCVLAVASSTSAT